MGPLMIVKMLHCKQNHRRHRHRSRNYDAVLLNKQTDDHDDFPLNNEPNTSRRLCRVCLKDGQISIFSHNRTDDHLVEALETFGGISVKIDDSHPKHLCQQCHSLLQGAIVLRKTALESEEKLKNYTDALVDQSDTNEHDNQSFSDDNIDEYVGHVSQNESNTKQITCKKCDIQFKSFNEYNEHRLSEEHENKKSVCTICKKTYTSSYLKTHMLLHTREMTYMCDICGKSFIVQAHLTRHRLTHFYELPFLCKLCPYKGRFKESLKMHMRSHTGEKPYRCEHCPVRCTSKSNLNKHLLTHTGEFHFKCDVCGRGCASKKLLETHFKVVHTGVKEYVCKACGKAFGYRRHLRKHELRMHKNITEKRKTGRQPLYLQLETMQEGTVSVEGELHVQ